MRLPRISVRRLIVVVAIAALACEVDQWRRRYTYCESNRARCAVEEGVHLRMAESHERISTLYRKLAVEKQGSVRYNTRQATIFEGAVKGEQAEAKKAADRGKAFRQAAIYPWLSLPTAEPEKIGWMELEERPEAPAFKSSSGHGSR